MSLKDDWRACVLELHAAGLSRGEIAEQVPISSAYVSQIVAEAGRSFAGRSRMEKASQSLLRKQHERRVAEAIRLIPLAEQAGTAEAVEIGDRIHELLGITEVDVLLRDTEWLNRVIGLPPGS